MKLSLRNLLRNLIGRGAARKRSRPTPTTRLQVEQLEQRLVPTVNLSSMEIGAGTGKGVPLVQTEQINPGQATFQGCYEDPNGHWIPVNGPLQQMGSWDQMTFPPNPTHPPNPIYPPEPFLPPEPITPPVPIHPPEPLVPPEPLFPPVPI